MRDLRKQPTVTHRKSGPGSVKRERAQRGQPTQGTTEASGEAAAE